MRLVSLKSVTRKKSVLGFLGRHAVRSLSRDEHLQEYTPTASPDRHDGYRTTFLSSRRATLARRIPDMADTIHRHANGQLTRPTTGTTATDMPLMPDARSVLHAFIR